MARTHAGDGRGHLAAMHVVLHRCAHCTRDVIDELALRHGVALLADSTGAVHLLAGGRRGNTVRRLLRRRYLNETTVAGP